ncbi:MULTISPECIES: hypothetical protein [unclassified Pedobacter]|uniref:hypothetical protein n=1 Tax=unclassified Pedobacter TaxID=2628915 RepID=UPI001E4973AD|nr:MULTISPECIES: hypothetical protein [unclassified Pedobacter]
MHTDIKICVYLCASVVKNSQLITLGGALLKGSITIGGGAILRKQALALPFR